MWWCLSKPHRWAGNICWGFYFCLRCRDALHKESKRMKLIWVGAKKPEKLAKKCWHPGRCMVLYLSAKRWDKRMTSESQLEVKRKEPIDVRKFRSAPRNRERSKFDKKRKTSKKSLTKNHFCDKIIKLSAAWLRRYRTLKIEQYRKTCNGTYFRVGKTR